jgi:hypothetical protein
MNPDAQAPMKSQSSHPSGRRGFALIVTISMLVLLSMVAIGLLSVSTITIRTTSRDAALLEARANARLALMLAIGELQKQLGPDQRVSAEGSILADTVNHPHWTGVWDSWRAGAVDRDEDSPDDPSEHRTIKGASNSGLHPTYTKNRSDHFRSWLVSLGPDESGEIATALSLSIEGAVAPGKDAKAVRLVERGSLGPNSAPEDFVDARLISLRSKPTGTTPTGRYGWWIGDESQKARIMDDTYEFDDQQTLAEKIFRHQAPGSTGTTTIRGLENLDGEEQLKAVLSLQTLSLVEGATDDAPDNFHHTTPYSYQVLADVREGGLKRDLSTLLERPIVERESSDQFMLYRFDTAGQERVPIQDLAAYYQLYRNKGVKYSSRLLRRGIQISNPDFASGGPAFKREYTNLYRLPVPIKLQFLLSTTAEPRTDAEKRANPRNTDTHKLHLAITPSMTLWNPYNVPLIMNHGDPVRYATQMRFFNLPIAIRWNKNGGQYISPKDTSLAWITNGLSSGGDRDTGFTLFFSGIRPIVFEPGEVRVFSLGNSGLNRLVNANVFRANREVVPGWDPNVFLKMPRSDQSTNSRHIEPPEASRGNGALTFSAGDRISFSIEATEDTELANGSALQFFMRQSSVSQAAGGHDRTLWMNRQYQLCSRMGSRVNGVVKTKQFNAELMRKSFPNEAPKINFPPRSGSSIIAADFEPFLLVNLVAGCETHESSNAGAYAGRHFPSRPFLHSTPITGTAFIDRSDDDSFYHHGWNWWVEDINSVFEANVAVNRRNQGFYGGGYTPEMGTTNVVQQEIPVVPPISIASLSHAHLGGFSLANEPLGPRASNTIEAFQRTTSSGQGGLFPHTLQAIGNSYAHPYIKPDEASTEWMREFSEDIRDRTVTLADHSYLANKALWDDYFFSSISPSITEIFEDPRRSNAERVAKRFFFEGEDLPNRRIVPYLQDLDENQLSKMFRDAHRPTGGLADLISSYLLVEGPFNINSTSAEAWKVFLSSLKGKNIAYLDKSGSMRAGLKLDEEEASGTPVSSFSLPNGAPRQGSERDPADPDQWTNWRDLTDDEIEELAIAIVEQVKLRGPFLSLSEFVNRRLDSSNRQLAVKGALQAALDDDSVSINDGFRAAARRFTPDELSKMNPKFQEALEGPVAYGSAAYVDQADLLRNLAAQLTPRGDTFVIRTYGDALDANGNVEARAWCEAVVQRVPDYLDAGEDDAHLKQADLNSGTNKNFGRKLRIVRFRFLSKQEI